MHILSKQKDNLIKLMRRGPNYLVRQRISTLKVIKLGIAYILYSSGLILVNIPGRFTKNHKKEKIFATIQQVSESGRGKKSSSKDK